MDKALRVLALAALAWQASVAQQPRARDVTLRTGLVITRSTRIVRRVYDLRADSSLVSAIIIVRGSDITVDFNGAELRGSPVSADPDQATGVAIRVEWKPRLFSLVEHESLADWMSFHHNEHREWLRFGAGIYLEDVHGDTGQGGANDNVVVGNDFSFAPTNGMEATFSRNDFIGNRIEGSEYGLWGGYSFGSRVIGNCFTRNRIGVAIEHGQDDSIVGNHFDGDSTGISIWANSIEASEWGYPKHRDTRSRDYRIADTSRTPSARYASRLKSRS